MEADWVGFMTSNLPSGNGGGGGGVDIMDIITNHMRVCSVYVCQLNESNVSLCTCSVRVYQLNESSVSLCTCSVHVGGGGGGGCREEHTSQSSACVCMCRLSGHGGFVACWRVGAPFCTFFPAQCSRGDWDGGVGVAGGGGAGWYG